MIIRAVFFITIDEPIAGIPDESSLIKSYALQRNLKLPLVGLQYFQALSCYRWASIIQGVYARSVWGNASDEESAQYVLGMVKPLAEAGLAFTRCVCVCSVCVCVCVCVCVVRCVHILYKCSFVCCIRVFYNKCHIEDHMIRNENVDMKFDHIFRCILCR